MRTWDIAKILIESCNSPEDVEAVINTLCDYDAAQHVCAFMSVFASYEASISYSRPETSAVQEVERRGSLREINRVVEAKGRESVTALSKEGSVDQLQSLFRANGMTNIQVEQWFAHNFGVQEIVGKDALRKYLTKVLTGVDSSLTDRIIASAKRLGNNDNSHSGNHKSDKSSTQKTVGYNPPPMAIDREDAEGSGRTTKFSSIEARVTQLEAIFRTIGMTNEQVEQWITDNFGLQELVGKHSLRRYLTRVLNGADLGLTNRLLAGAQRLAIDTGSPVSDIKEYWDQLDKHFAVVE